MRYAAKILLHDVNKSSKMMSDLAIKFDEDHNDQEEQKKMVEEAIRSKAAEEKHQLILMLFSKTIYLKKQFMFMCFRFLNNDG